MTLPHDTHHPNPDEPVGGSTSSARRGERAALCYLAVAALCYLALSGLDARSTALLSGSLTFFGLKTLALDVLLLAGFAWSAYPLWRAGEARADGSPRRGRPLAWLVSGAAIWRALDATTDALSALAADDLQYWRPAQFATVTFLAVAGVTATLATLVLAITPPSHPTNNDAPPR